MPLSDWLANRWIVAHSASVQEITDLFAVVDRDLTDAATPRLSDDWRLGITYNAALQLATIALAAAGYRVDLLDVVRRKRNQASYEVAGSTSPREADELYKLVEELRLDVLRWLRKNRAELCPPNLKT
jgi:hypothetical protein